MQAKARATCNCSFSANSVRQDDNGWNGQIAGQSKRLLGPFVITFENGEYFTSPGYQLLIANEARNCTLRGSGSSRRSIGTSDSSSPRY